MPDQAQAARRTGILCIVHLRPLGRSTTPRATLQTSSADLMRRILTQRGPFRKAAEFFATLLGKTQLGCCYNPTVGQAHQRRSHRCLDHRQIVTLQRILNAGPLQVLERPSLDPTPSPRFGQMIALSARCSLWNRTYTSPHAG